MRNCGLVLWDRERYRSIHANFFEALWHEASLSFAL
jgi:hypothetical protein